jgi:hypothetical protein
MVALLDGALHLPCHFLETISADDTELSGMHLQTVAYAEDGHAELVDGGVSMGRILIVDRVR